MPFLQKLLEVAFKDWYIPLFGFVVLALALAFKNISGLRLARLSIGKILGEPFFDERIGAILLARSLKQLDRNQLEPALSGFVEASKYLDPIRIGNPKSRRLQRLLDDPRLALLYSVRGWRSLDNDFESSLKDAEAALRLDPASGDARICRGWAKLRRKLLNDAIDAKADFSQALSSKNARYITIADAQHGRAEALRLQGEYDDAIAAFSALIETNPTWASGYFKRGDSYYIIGKYQSGLDDMEMAFSLGYRDCLALARAGDACRMLGLLDKSVDLCEQAALCPPVTFDPYFFSGLALYQKAQGETSAVTKLELLRRAEQKLRTAMALAPPALSQATHYLAAIQSELGNPEEAERLRAQARMGSSGNAVQPQTYVPALTFLWPAVKEAFALTRLPKDLAITLSDAQELVRREPHNAAAHFGVGLLNFKTGLLQDAIWSFDRALDLDPKLGNAYFWRSYAHGLLGNWKLALQDCSSAVSHDPSMPEAYRLRAVIRKSLRASDDVTDDIDKAFALISDAMTKSPPTTFQYSFRAELSLDAGRINEALADANQSLKLNNANAVAYRIRGDAFLRERKFDLAIQDLNHSVSLFNGDPNAFCLRGDAQRNSGNLTAAISDLDEAIKLNRDCVQAYHLRGWTRIAQWVEKKDDQLQHAVDDFSEVIRRLPADPAGYSARAWGRLKQYEDGKATLDLALSDTRFALDRNSGFALTHFVRGWIFYARGEWEQARTAFSTAISLESENYGAFYGRAEAARRLGTISEALADYDKAITLAAGVGIELWQAYWMRGAAQETRTDWEAVAKDYRSAIELSSKAVAARTELADLHSALAAVYYQLGSDDLMWKEFGIAEELNSDSRQLHDLRGWMLLYLGRWSEATQAFTRLIELEPKSSLGFVNRGVVRTYAGELPSAIADLETALALNDKDASAWQILGWAHLRRNEWDSALREYTKAIALSTDDTFRFNGRALANIWLAQPDKALEDLNEILKIRLANCSLGFPRRRREDAVGWGATAEDWTGCIAAMPSASVPALGRAISRWMAGDLDGAAEDVGTAGSRGLRDLALQRVRDGIERERSSKAPTK